MDVFKTHHSRNEEETSVIAQNMANALEKNDIVFLSGPLGAGKSVMARGIIRAISRNPNEDIPSPTFTLVQQYETNKGLLWHYDLYRLEAPEEIYETGWEDIIGEDLILIEWAEKLGNLKPQSYISIKIIPEPDQTRTIEIKKIK